MSLQPHQLRVVAERDDLNRRVESLRAFIRSDTFKAVERDERRRLIRQEVVMTEFAEILSERIAAFESAAAPAPEDFALGKACDLSGEGTCEACQ